MSATTSTYEYKSLNFVPCRIALLFNANSSTGAAGAPASAIRVSASTVTGGTVVGAGSDMTEGKIEERDCKLTLSG